MSSNKNRDKNREGKRLETYGFNRTNVLILLASLVVIAIGYILMSGGGAESIEEFNTEAFNARRISLAPIVCTIGYLGIIVAILKK